MERPIATAGQFHDTGNSRPRYNRTGATLVQGGVGFVDYAQGDGDSTTLALGMANVVAVSTALIATRPKLVVAADAGAVDNAKANFFEGTDIICYVNVDSTTDIAKGDWLKPVNAGDHLVKATAFSVNESGSATDALVPVYAQALEARTSNDEGVILARLFSNGVIW